MFDRYGRGLSDVATDPSSGRPARHSAALFAQQLNDLLHEINLEDGAPLWQEKLVVVGSSMGGLIATEFAAMHPDLVRRLVLLAPAGLTPWVTLERKVMMFPGVGRLYHALFGKRKEVESILRDKFGYDVMYLESRDPVLLEQLTNAALWQLNEKPGYIWDVYRSITQIQWDGQQRNAEFIGTQTMDVQLVWGSEDYVVWHYFAQFWQQAMPQAKLNTLDGEAHTPHLVDARIPQLVDIIMPLVPPEQL